MKRGFQFAALRRFLGFTQVEVSFATAISPDKISRFERGLTQLNAPERASLEDFLADHLARLTNQRASPAQAVALLN